MRTLVIGLALLAGVVLGGLVLLTLGWPAAAFIGVPVLATVLLVPRADRARLRALLAFNGVVLLAAGGVATLLLLRVAAAMEPSLPAADPDPGALAAASTKLADLGDAATFRLELTEAELTAVVQEGLRTNPNAPLRTIALDVRDGFDGGQGSIVFSGELAGGGVVASGEFTADVIAGDLRFDLIDLEVGGLDLPGAAAEGVAATLRQAVDLEGVLAQAGADVQSLSLGNDRVVVIGTQAGGDVLTSLAVIDGLRAQAQMIGATPPPERVGPGRVNALSAAGEPTYLALGDSLAANVGVEEPRLGYVSRFHRFLEERSGAALGLENVARSGETSASLLRGGQLDRALEVIASRDVTIITVNIGANDLLGHLTSPDCASDLAAPACRRRVADSTAAYRANLEELLDRLRTAAPDADIMLLTTYNPFSLGVPDSQFEAQSNAILSDFNVAASEVARARGVVVADGFTPLRGFGGVATHMLDNPPDIHPTAVGFDVLAGALVDAVL